MKEIEVELGKLALGGGSLDAALKAKWGDLVLGISTSTNDPVVRVHLADDVTDVEIEEIAVDAIDHVPVPEPPTRDERAEQIAQLSALLTAQAVEIDKLKTDVATLKGTA